MVIDRIYFSIVFVAVLAPQITPETHDVSGEFCFLDLDQNLFQAVTGFNRGAEVKAIHRQQADSSIYFPLVNVSGKFPRTKIEGFNFFTY